MREFEGGIDPARAHLRSPTTMIARYCCSLACLVALTALLPDAARAYYVESRGTDTLVPIRYADADDPPAGTVDVTYRVNAATFPAGVVGVDVAIDAAFAAWTAADCSVLSFAAGAASESVDRAHWRNDMGAIYILVYFSDTDEEWGGTPAVGHFFFNHDGTGTLTGGSVVLNSRDHMWATDGAAGSLDVQSVVTALIGRSLGLTSTIEMNATFPRYSPGDQSKQTLGADDLAGIQYLYPSDETACGVPMMPEAECDGVPPAPGEERCPPRPMTNPGDGGTLDPDAGVRLDGGGAGADAGMSTTDGGTGGGGGDGCTCRVGSRSRSSSGAPLLLALVFTALLFRRDRV